MSISTQVDPYKSLALGTVLSSLNPRLCRIDLKCLVSESASEVEHRRALYAYVYPGLTHPVSRPTGDIHESR